MKGSQEQPPILGVVSKLAAFSVLHPLLPHPKHTPCSELSCNFFFGFPEIQPETLNSDLNMCRMTQCPNATDMEM